MTGGGDHIEVNTQDTYSVHFTFFGFGIIGSI